METLSREQMIIDLTKFELESLLLDKDLIDDAVRFFSIGGYQLWTDKKLLLYWDYRFKNK